MTERIKIVTHTSPAIVVIETNKLLENGFEILSEHVTQVGGVLPDLKTHVKVAQFTVFLIERMRR